MYYFRIQAELRKLTSSTTFALKSCDFRAGAAKVCFVYYLCDECSENSPAQVPRWGPRWGPRELFLSREDGAFRNEEFQTAVISLCSRAARGFARPSLSWREKLCSSSTAAKQQSGRNMPANLHSSRPHPSVIVFVGAASARHQFGPGCQRVFCT